MQCNRMIFCFVSLILLLNSPFSFAEDPALNVILIRHSDAVSGKEGGAWDESGQPDHLRPLSEKGLNHLIEAMPAMMEFVPEIDHLYVGRYTRSVQTAEAIRDHYSLDSYQEVVDLNPGATLEQLLGVIEAHGPGEVLALVGHRHELEMLLSFLLLKSDDMPTPIELNKGSVTLLQTDDNESYQFILYRTQKELRP